MKVLIVGFGWLGSAIGQTLVSRGDRVIGVRRTESAAGEMAAAGVEPLVLDITEPGAAQRVPADVESVIVCAAPKEGSVVAYRRTYVDLNRAMLDAAKTRRLRAYVYTGSTGVFGQDDDRIVDEMMPVAPGHEAAGVLVTAEKTVLDSATRDGVPTRLVRLSGLYGPGRLGVIERVRTGRLALGPGDDAWTNWCHRDDAVTAVIAALDRGSPGAVYHGSDARPVRRREIVRWVASRLGIEPHRDDADLGRRPSRPNRRISSEATRRQLGFELRYPSIQDGLAPHLR